MVSGDKNDIPQNQTTSHNVPGRPKMDKNTTSKTQNRVKLDPFGCFEGNPKKTPIWKGFDPDPKSWTKTDLKGSKRGQKWPNLGSKMTKIGSNLGFGVKVGDFWGKKGRSAHQKWAKGHFRGLKIGFDKDFWQEVRPIAGNPDFRVWSERGEEENLEGWFFVTKMKNQYENFWWTKLGKMKIM